MSQSTEKCTNVLPCDGTNCYLVDTLKNQAAANLVPGAVSHPMPEQAFRNFLKRIEAEIPICCQQALAQAVFDQVKQQADDFFRP